ncbi:MAG: cytochrome c3 family protein [Desulfobacteraceae bacterium]|nr:cytochrome c3 family protein [Desulfobacteraceae bacterium]
MRMSRGLIVCLSAALIFGTAVGIAGGSDEMCVPMGDISLVAPIDEPKRSEVNFPHTAHFDLSCKQCHHTWDGVDPISGCMASGCHDLSESPGKSEDKALKGLPEIRYYKKAYHQQCIGCHQDIKSKNAALERSNLMLEEPLPSAGPTGCVECHPKE